MKKIKRFLSICLVWFCAGSALAAFFCVFLFKPILTSMLELSWGVDIQIQAVRADFSEPGIILESVTVGNPYGFPRGDMLKIKKIEWSFRELDYSKKSLFFGPIRVFVDEIKLMRRVSGHLNLELFVKSDPKQNGLTVIPSQTYFYIEKVTEEDSTGPLLKRSNLPIENKEILVTQQTTAHEVMAVFSEKLLAGIPAPRAETASLPPPEYKGIVASVEESLRDQAEKISEESAGFIPAEPSPDALKIGS